MFLFRYKEKTRNVSRYLSKHLVSRYLWFCVLACLLGGLLSCGGGGGSSSSVPEEPPAVTPEEPSEELAFTAVPSLDGKKMTFSTASPGLAVVFTGREDCRLERGSKVLVGKYLYDPLPKDVVGVLNMSGIDPTTHETVTYTGELRFESSTTGTYSYVEKVSGVRSPVQKASFAL